MKAIPYGISDFPRIRREDYYYVDKTRYIELMERQRPIFPHPSAPLRQVLVSRHA